MEIFSLHLFLNYNKPDIFIKVVFIFIYFINSSFLIVVQAYYFPLICLLINDCVIFYPCSIFYIFHIKLKFSQYHKFFFELFFEFFSSTLLKRYNLFIKRRKNIFNNTFICVNRLY